MLLGSPEIQELVDKYSEAESEFLDERIKEVSEEKASVHEVANKAIEAQNTFFN